MISVEDWAEIRRLRGHRDLTVCGAAAAAKARLMVWAGTQPSTPATAATILTRACGSPVALGDMDEDAVVAETVSDNPRVCVRLVAVLDRGWLRA